MELHILNESDKSRYREEILALLRESDEDFLPPLSKRSSTRDNTFSESSTNKDGVLSYYKAMNQQHILAALDLGGVVGFVSFYENFTDGEQPNIYVSTLVVSKSKRGPETPIFLNENGNSFLSAVGFARRQSSKLELRRVRTYSIRPFCG